MVFSYKKAKFGAFEKITLRHPKTKNGFSIIPGAGANVPELFFGGKNILDGYKTPEELEAGKWSKSILLFPFPNRLQDGRYTWLGKTYHFPINNAATQNAIHGLLQRAPFEVIRVLLTEAAAEITVQHEYKGENSAYPFPFTLNMTFGISNTNKFRVSYDLLNRHNDLLPFGFGWHPYFILDENANDTSLLLPECDEVAIDHRMIPTGQLKPFNAYRRMARLGESIFDTCFRSKTRMRYRMAIKGKAGRLSISCDPNLFPYFQVFTPPHRQSVALEPMTCNINAFNNQDGLIKVAPGGISKGDFFLEFEKRK